MYTSYDFQYMYQDYYTRIYRYFHYRVKNSWDVEDLTTAVFLKAFSKLEQFNAGKALAPWLFSIARNTLVDFRRKKREFLATDDLFIAIPIDDKQLPDIRLINKETSELLWKNVQLLSAIQRNVIIFRYYSDLRTEEIAMIMGKSEASIRTAQHRGIKKLKCMLKYQINECEISDPNSYDCLQSTGY